MVGASSGAMPPLWFFLWHLVLTFFCMFFLYVIFSLIILVRICAI